MELSTQPSQEELDSSFAARRRPTYDELTLLSQRIRAIVIQDELLYVVEIDSPARDVLTHLTPSGEAVNLRPVAEFYTFHTVNWAHSTFRPTLAEIFASIPPELLNDHEVYGVSVRNICSNTEFGGEDWHVGIATAYISL